MKAKIIMLSALGVASFGLTQAANAGWDNSDSSGAATPCIEYNGSNHFNVNDTDRSDWHGTPGTGSPAGTWNNGVNPADPFVFSGETHLVCNDIEVDCTLSLSGYTRITGDDPYSIGIMVTDADVTGGFTCGFVDVGGFPWFIADNGHHDPFTIPPALGVPYTNPMTFEGSIGPIDVDVNLLGIHVADGHMHDVTYNNLDTFSFGTNGNDPVIYNWNGTSDVPSGCTVSGNLELQAPGTSLKIY